MGHSFRPILTFQLQMFKSGESILFNIHHLRL